jgi:hypothetical protein
MPRALLASVVAACAAFGASASACEWHEMMAYGYGGDVPQRYSAFSRAEQHPAAHDPQPTQQSDNAAEQAAETADQVQDGGDAAERARADVDDGERTESVLAARR